MSGHKVCLGHCRLVCKALQSFSICSASQGLGEFLDYIMSALTQ